MGNKKWSCAEIELLKDMYLSKGLSKTEIVPYFSRNSNAIGIKIKRLKLRHNKTQTKNIKSRLNKGSKNGMYGKTGPNKGLTKYNSDRIKKAGEKISKLRREGYKTGKYKKKYGKENPMYGRAAWSRGLTRETSEKIRLSSEKLSKTKKLNWKNLSEEEKEKKSIFLASLFKFHKRGKKIRTKIELKIEKILRKYDIKFKGSFPLGRFFVDFYLPQYNYVIECFGDYWHCNPDKYQSADKYQLKNRERDERKKGYLKKKGIKLLILWEKDINEDIEKVLYRILEFIGNFDFCTGKIPLKSPKCFNYVLI